MIFERFAECESGRIIEHFGYFAYFFAVFEYQNFCRFQLFLPEIFAGSFAGGGSENVRQIAVIVAKFFAQFVKLGHGKNMRIYVSAYFRAQNLSVPDVGRFYRKTVEIAYIIICVNSASSSLSDSFSSPVNSFSA